MKFVKCAGRSLHRVFLFSMLALLLASIPVWALRAETVVFHCQTSCKVYVDGKLQISLPSGGVKQTDLVSGRRVILITRPGKPDWVRIVTLTSPLSIDPADKAPTVISEDNGQENTSKSAERRPEIGTTPNEMAQSHTLPSWAGGSWKFRVRDKKFQLTEGSISCAAAVNQTLRVYLDANRPSTPDTKYNKIDFSQWIQIDDDNEPCLSYSVDHEGNQDWEAIVPIVLTVENQDRLSFTAVMEKCYTDSKNKGCKLPNRDQISGTIQRVTNDQIEVELVGPLPGKFTLDKLSDQ